MKTTLSTLTLVAVLAVGSSALAQTQEGTIATLQLAEGEEHHFQLSGTAGQSLSVDLSGKGDPDLYVRFGTRPTTSAWDCRPYSSGAAESCTLTVPTDATDAFISVRGYIGGSYTLDYRFTAGKTKTPPKEPAPSQLEADPVELHEWSIDAMTEHHYELPPSPFSRQVCLADNWGDADLYVRDGGRPTTESYDCRPYLRGSTECCEVPGSKTKRFIMVRGWDPATNYTLELGD